MNATDNASPDIQVTASTILDGLSLDPVQLKNYLLGLQHGLELGKLDNRKEAS